MTSKNQIIPDWAADAVWYQIFPERFRNGCRQSNPVLSDTGVERLDGWRVSEWDKDWYARDPWEGRDGDFYKLVHCRRFGGDLVGVREKLDYLQDLGVNAIYLNPVFMAQSLHKYDATCYHHIDPTFGPDREGDLAALRAADETDDPSTWIWTAADRFFLELIKDVHQRGMRIIIDGVFNHTGRAFFAFQDLLKNGRKSPYRDWYRMVRWDKRGRLSYKGWFGHQSLPELGRTRDNLRQPVRDYIYAITSRWMDPNGDGDPSDGIDGWRLDVAFCLPHGFWKEWRRVVKGINPNAYLCGEIVKLAGAYLRGDELDAVMNYMWTYPTLCFFSPGESPISSRMFRSKLNRVRKAYPREVNYGLQNLLDSHDVGRVLTMLENPDKPRSTWDEYFNASRVPAHGDLVTTKPASRAYQILRQMVMFQMTYLGAPMIYYGTEVGMWGANDPDNRQPMFWDDVAHQSETHGPFGRVKKSVRAPDSGLFEFYRKAIGLRAKHRVLRRGELTWLEHRNPRMLGYVRSDKGEKITAWLNASDEPVEVTLDKDSKDLWNNQRVKAGSVSVEPRGWLVVKLM